MGIFLKLGPLHPNPYEAVLKDIFLSLKNQFFSYMQEFYKYEALGKKKKAAKALLCANKIMFLQFYVLLVKIDVESKLNGGECLPADYLEKNYNFTCIRNTFICMGIDFDKVMAAAGLPKTLEGIGYMAIEEGCQIFEIL